MGRKREFGREVKNSAVKLVTDGDQILLSVTNMHGNHENMPGKRRYAINPGTASNGEPVQDETGAREKELQRLRRRVRELEDENVFLKKVSEILAKNPQ